LTHAQTKNFLLLKTDKKLIKNEKKTFLRHSLGLIGRKMVQVALKVHPAALDTLDGATNTWYKRTAVNCSSFFVLETYAFFQLSKYL